MSKKITYDYCNKLVKEFEKVIKNPIKEKTSAYYTGVDLGTSCIVLAVLDENKKPVAGAYRYANVVKDGMVVDYIGAVRIVRELKEEIEEKVKQMARENTSYGMMEDDEDDTDVDTNTAEE